MASFNKVILVGNLTRDPQIKYTTGGTAIAEIGLAVNRKWKDGSGQWKDETTFVDITLWGRTAEVAGEYLEKGKPVLIEGRLQLDQWDDRETGQKRSKLKVVGEHLTMLGGGQGQQGGGRDSQGSRERSQGRGDSRGGSGRGSGYAGGGGAGGGGSRSTSGNSGYYEGARNEARPQYSEAGSHDEDFGGSSAFESFSEQGPYPTDDEVPF